MIVMMTAMTPSLKDSRRRVPMMFAVASEGSSLIGCSLTGVAAARTGYG